LNFICQDLESPEVWVSRNVLTEYTTVYTLNIMFGDKLDTLFYDIVAGCKHFSKLWLVTMQVLL